MIKEAMAILREKFGRTLTKVDISDEVYVAENDANSQTPTSTAACQRINHDKSPGSAYSTLEPNASNTNKEHVSANDAIPRTLPRTVAPQEISHIKSPSRLRGEAKTSPIHNLVNVPAKPPLCPKCAGKMWDSIAYADWGNGLNRDGSKKPVFTCRDQGCGYSIWAKFYQNGESIPPACPQCGGEMGDNLASPFFKESGGLTRSGKTGPVFTCKDKSCKNNAGFVTSIFADTYQNGNPSDGYYASPEANPYNQGGPPEPEPAPPVVVDTFPDVAQVVDLELLAMQVWGKEAWIEGLREKAEGVIGKNDYLLATSDELYNLQNILEVIRPRLNIEKPYHIEKDHFKRRATEITTSALGEEFEYIFNTEGEIAEEITLSPMPTHFHIPQVKELEWRDYQEKAIRDCWKAFQEGYYRIYYKMSVAGGKTLTSAAMADNWLREDKPVLWLAHNKKLLKQAASTFALLGWYPLHEQGEQQALIDFIFGKSKLVIGSVASLRGDRLKKWPRDSFSLIVYDECDMALAPTNVELIRHFNTARLLGMTGTDDRGDGKNLGSLFQLRIKSLDLVETTAKSMTVPIVRNKIRVEPGIDLRKLKKKKDFDEKELGQIIASESELICSVLSQEQHNTGGIANRPTMVFCPDIHSSEVIADNLNKFGITAKALHSKMSPRQREVGEREFVAGQYQCLVNAVAYTVGTDFPFVSCIVLLRPTKVRRLLEQIIGRGVRLPDNNPLSRGKEDCLVIDFPWIVGDVHKLIHTADIYDDGTLAEPIKERVKEIMDERTCTPQEAKERAEREAEIAGFRKQHMEFKRRQVMVRSMVHDPLSMFDFLGLKQQTRTEEFVGWQRPSDFLVSQLRQFKVPNPEKLSFGQAQRLTSNLIKRRNKHLCSPAQARYLLDLGADPDSLRNMKTKDASAAIQRLKEARGY